MSFLPFPLNVAAGFIGKNWRWFAIAGLAIVGCLVVKLHYANDAKTAKDAATYKAAYDDWRRYGLAEQKAFAAQKGYRSDEASQAIDSLKSANLACDARVSEARRSAKAIKELVYAPPKVVNGCPVRGSAALMPSDRLFDAIGAR